eukprot:1106306-Rhodomonas_salina.3
MRVFDSAGNGVRARTAAGGPEVNRDVMRKKMLLRAPWHFFFNFGRRHSTVAAKVPACSVATPSPTTEEGCLLSPSGSPTPPFRCASVQVTGACEREGGEPESQRA